MSQETLLHFGIAIRNIRQKRQISQECLADMCDLHRTYISDIELGKRNISLDNIEKIAVAFDMKISELFIEVENYEGV